MAGNVKHLTQTPLALQQELPWEKMKKAIIIFEDHEENICFSVTEMDWRDRTHLTQELCALNQAIATLEYISLMDAP